MNAQHVDKMTFIKYNSSYIRNKILTDFYTEQTIEAIKYNIEHLIENTKDTYKEETRYEKR